MTFKLQPESAGELMQVPWMVEGVDMEAQWVAADFRSSLEILSRLCLNSYCLITDCVFVEFLDFTDQFLMILSNWMSEFDGQVMAATYRAKWISIVWISIVLL